MKKIKLFLLPKDQVGSKNAIIEIRAGQEGLISLYRPLQDGKKVVKKKWIIEIISISKSDAGGLKEALA